MIALAFGLLGGIGLFLLGMTLLTDGLKSFAGDNLRMALLRFTDKPSKAFAAGALVTALVQSSSATTVTVIGFVSAGLLAFTPAVSVVLGASLGTTATGWLVSVVGLKVSVGFYALPLIGIGAFLRLLGRGRGRALGLAIAGFGLIFVGIETLQRSMEGLSEVFRLSEMPAAGFTGHLLTMLIGLLMTVVMQSSSAAVATTLTALHTGSIAFDQAASLVIGAAIGTTVTGALAAIGGSVPAKRTALAHVLFNSATGLIAIVMLPALLYVIEWAQQRFGLDPGAVSLAAFHTLFISAGVLVFLPFVDRFARRIERLLPERKGVFTRNLDASLLSLPVIALETTRQTLNELALEFAALLQDHIRRHPAQPLNEARIRRAGDETRKTHAFFVQIPAISDVRPLSDLRVALIHAIDHLLRLEEYLHVPPAVGHTFSHPEMMSMVGECRSLLDEAKRGLTGQGEAGWEQAMAGRAERLLAFGEQRRAEIIGRTAQGKVNAADATAMLDTMRWAGRVGNHMERVCLYLQRTSPAPQTTHADLPEAHELKGNSN